jgi:ATP-dependent DNA helicase RecQ
VGDTVFVSLDLFRKGREVEAIARERGLTVGTIYTHLAAAMDSGQPIDLNKILTTEEQDLAMRGFTKCGWGNLTGVHEALGGKIDYGKLRLFRASHARQNAQR